MAAQRTLDRLREVLIPFNAQKIDGCRLVFLNRLLPTQLADDELLEQYSYRAIAATSALPCSSRLFYAERYGGDAILRNGGGGRCGFDGRFQLKGMGPNALVGRDVDASHANGFLCLAEAIYETLWAEVVSFALPYGAPRTVGIIHTRERFSLFAESHHQALLIREAAVRPAHFMRAIYFKPAVGLGLESDATRVRKAMQRLAEFLPARAADSPPAETVEHGLLEIAGRFAEQFATARVKRMLHFNVSASNLSMEGGWLDLSSTTLFSNRLSIERWALHRLDREYEPALLAIKDICFYAFKYLGMARSSSHDLYRRAVAEFERRYRQRQSLTLAAQFGIPLFLLNSVSSSQMLFNFTDAVLKVLEHDDFSLIPIELDTGWDGFEYGFAAFARSLICHLGAADTMKTLPEGVVESLVQDAIDTLGRLIEMILDHHAQAGLTRHALLTAMLIGMTRYSRCSRLLLLNELEPWCKALAEAASTAPQSNLVNEKIMALVAEAKLTLNFCAGDTVLMWSRPGLEIHYAPLTDGYHVSTDAQVESVDYHTLKAYASSHCDIAAALRFHNHLESLPR